MSKKDCLSKLSSSEEELNAGIVVLGILGTGLFCRFPGNTAEQLIDHIKCDLLAIKPDMALPVLSLSIQTTNNAFNTV